jgi:lipopolysaccharide heptosyltransferase II
VDWYLSVLDHLGVPTQRPFVWLPQRPGVAAVLHQKWPLDGSPWIMLQPGARWPNKRWPVERFADVVRLIAAEFAHVRFAVLGGASDRSLGRALAAAAAPSRCLDLTGQTSLTETIEWIRLSRLMVTNDTGPMHLAAALGKPVVALFGPTDPRRTGPYHQLHGVLRASLPCAPCLKDICAHSQPLECLHRIPPAEVVARVRAVLHPAARSA